MSTASSSFNTATSSEMNDGAGNEQEAARSTSGAAVEWSLSIKPVGSETSSSSPSSSPASSRQQQQRRRGGGGEQQQESPPGSSLSSCPSSSAAGATAAGGANNNNNNNKDFTVRVRPEDDLSRLYERIQDATGLKASQQRLIYRGRLIDDCNVGGGGGGDGGAEEEEEDDQETEDEIRGGGEKGAGKTEPSSSRKNKKKASTIKIKDITGLCDGQTIHLVRRRDRQQQGSGNGGNAAASPRTGDASAGGASGNDAEEGELIGSGSIGAAPLLAALLGLGEGSDQADRGSGGGGAGSGGQSNETAGAAARRWNRRYGGGGGGAGASSRSRRQHHRLTADDLESVPDPGSMDSVRQGLMTLHTILPAARAAAVSAASADQGGGGEGQRQRRAADRPPAVDANRRWYIGQWIDCLDTVNQWLEATVAEIVYPDDILPSPAGDVDGDKKNEKAEGSADDDGSAEARESASISPSPRRTPTSPRSSTSSQHPHFSDAVVTAGDMEGRLRLLLEPCEEGDERDFGGELSGYRRRDDDDDVQLLLIHYNGWPHRWDEWIRSDSDRIRPFRVRTRHPNASQHASPTPQSAFSDSPPTFIRSETDSLDRSALLPELSRVLSAVDEMVRNSSAAAAASAVATRGSEPTRTDRYAADLPWSTNIVEETPAGNTSVNPACQRRALEALAPLLDRLGRTLIDAAPHVAALARSRTSETARDNEELPEMPPIEEHPTSLGGLLSLLGRDRRRASTASNNVVVAGDQSSAQGSVQTGAVSEETSASIDPDLADFAYGIVNTTRGDVRRGPRNASLQSDDAAGLLGAYLAAASLGGGGGGDAGGNNNDDEGGLGRLLRERGTGGGGIDIHIHAIVTAPGMPIGGMGLTTLGGGGGGGGLTPEPTLAGTGGPSTLFSSSRGFGRGSLGRQSPRTPVVPTDDEDMGIFAELYSENPEPVDPNGTPTSGAESSTAGHRAEPGTRSGDRQSHHAPLRTRSFSSQGRNVSGRSARRANSSRSDLERGTGSRRNGRGVLGRLFRRNDSNSR